MVPSSKVRDRLSTIGTGLANWIFGIGIIIVLVLVALGVFTIYSFWTGEISATRSQIILAAFSGLGTLLLAGGTFLSLRQNRNQIVNLQRERKKPIVIDEINYFIQPSIFNMEIEMKNLKDDNKEIEWDFIDPNDDGLDLFPRTITTVGTTILRDRDLTAMKRFEENAPQLSELIQEREEVINDAASLANDIISSLKKSVTQFIEENEIRNVKGGQPDIDILINAIINKRRGYAESHSDYEVWEEHKEEFLSMREQMADEFEQLEAYEEEILSLSEEVRDELRSRKISLREEYGISSEDIRSEDPVKGR